jgi:hypothetical protein
MLKIGYAFSHGQAVDHEIVIGGKICPEMPKFEHIILFEAL